MNNIRTLCIACLSTYLILSAGCSDETAKATSPSPNTPANISVETITATNTIEKVIETFNVGENAYVRSLAVEEDSNSLWVGTSTGVHEIDLESFSPKNTFTREHGLANEYVFGIGIDEDGYKWFGTNAGGISRYKDGDWKTFFPMHGLADYWVYTFANGKDGGLWVGTWAGANYIDRKTEKFTTYVKELVNEWVYGLGVDSKGDVWFGTEGGVTRFDGKDWISWTHKDGLGAPNKNALPFSKNTGLGTRSRHDLGILAGGVATYNPNYIFSILVDRRDDSIWAGTWGGGVSHFSKGKWQNLTMTDGLVGNIVYSIAQAENNVLWFGTNRGLSRFDGKSWTNWNIQSGLTGNDVFAIAIAPNGDIWAGTRGGVTRLGLQALNSD